MTIISGDFFYNDYSVKHFITLNRPILIKTIKNIVISINNNAFTYSFIGNTEPSGTESSTAKYSDISNKSSNNKGKSATYFYNNNNNDVNIENFTVNIDLLNYYFNNDG